MTNPNLIGLLGGLHEITSIKCSAQRMAHSKHLISANSIVVVMVSVIKSFLPRLIGKVAVNNYL